MRLRSGTQIPEGATVVIDLLAVNRDPEVFGQDAGAFDPYRPVPRGVAPFGLSFAAGMHVCIGQDLAAGVVPGAAVDQHAHLFGLVTAAVQHLFRCGVRRDPDDPPERDANTSRPYWGRYPRPAGRNGMSYRASVAKDVCMSSGRCVADAPDAFVFDGDELAEAVPGHPGLSDSALVELARACPSGAIMVHDEQGAEIEVG